MAVYRNKLQNTLNNSDGKYFYKNYASQIVRTFRRTANNTITKVWNRDPTFSEFVEYLIATEPTKYDEHWKPMHSYCHVCNIRYNFVLKYELFQEETESFIKYLIRKQALDLNFKLHWANKIGTNEAITRKCLQQISHQQLQHIIEKYKYDFLLFDYDPYLYS